MWEVEAADVGEAEPAIVVVQAVLCLAQSSPRHRRPVSVTSLLTSWAPMPWPAWGACDGEAVHVAGNGAVGVVVSDVQHQPGPHVRGRRVVYAFRASI